MRIDARLERIEVKQRGSETMDGADVTSFYITQCVVNAPIESFFGKLVASGQRFGFSWGFLSRIPCAFVIASADEVGVQALAQAELQFVGGFVGERERDDLGDSERVGVAQKQMHQPLNQESCFARARAGRDD